VRGTPTATDPPTAALTVYALPYVLLVEYDAEIDVDNGTTPLTVNDALAAVYAPSPE
jgi:hypothetical protein